MLGRWLRLLLLFELFGHGLLIAVLVRQSGWPLVAALLLSLLLALLGRAWPIVWIHLHAHFHAQQANETTRPPDGWNLRLLLREILAFSALMFFAAFEPLLMRRDAPRRLKHAAHEMNEMPPPLLLVHGYLCNRGLWWWLKPRLEAAGRSVATLTLEPLYGDIDGYAEQIARRVAWLSGQTGAERVILVGYSMGGLACLAYLRRYGEDRVAKLVTLGTPHRGSAAVGLSFGRNARQMETGSNWLAELAAFFADMPLRVPAIAYYSLQDDMVLPPGNAMMAGAENRQLPAMGHLAMSISPRVLDALLKE